MDDAKAAWDDVGDRFTGLAAVIRARYEEAARTAGAGDATGEATPPGEAAQEAEQGLQRFVDALDRAFTAVGEAVRDPSFREQAKQAAVSVGDALGATLVDVGEELRRMFGGPRDEPQAPERAGGSPDTAAPPTGDGQEQPPTG